MDIVNLIAGTGGINNERPKSQTPEGEEVAFDVDAILERDTGDGEIVLESALIPQSADAVLTQSDPSETTDVVASDAFVFASSPELTLSLPDETPSGEVEPEETPDDIVEAQEVSGADDPSGVLVEGKPAGEIVSDADTAPIQGVSSDDPNTPVIAAELTASEPQVASAPSETAQASTQLQPASADIQVNVAQTTSQISPRAVAGVSVVESGLSLRQSAVSRVEHTTVSRETHAPVANASIEAPRPNTPVVGMATATLPTAAPMLKPGLMMEEISLGIMPAPSSSLAHDIAVHSASTAAPKPIVQPAPIVQDIVAQLVRSNSGRVEIRLDPPELGRIVMQLTPTESGMMAQVSAERSDVLDLMRRYESLLQRELGQAGFDNINLNFTQNWQSEQETAEDERNSGARSQSAALDGERTIDLAAMRNGQTGLDIRL
jgi:flagellar hook-length control protein FliK